MTDQADLDKFIQTMEAIREAIEAVVETIKPIFDKLIEALGRAHEAITRSLLFTRLKGFGLPEKWARKIAKIWPKKLLPVRWAWAPILAPPA